MGCFSGRLMFAASDQKLFCKLCSPFCCSFNEFVEEKVITPSYSSAILTPPSCSEKFFISSSPTGRQMEATTRWLLRIFLWKALSHVWLFATPYSPWNSGQKTGVRSLSLLQGIFPTQGLNPGLLHWGQILCQLSHQGSIKIEMQYFSCFPSSDKPLKYYSRTLNELPFKCTALSFQIANLNGNLGTYYVKAFVFFNSNLYLSCFVFDIIQSALIRLADFCRVNLDRSQCMSKKANKNGAVPS